MNILNVQIIFLISLIIILTIIALYAFKKNIKNSFKKIKNYLGKKYNLIKFIFFRLIKRLIRFLNKEKGIQKNRKYWVTFYTLIIIISIFGVLIYKSFPQIIYYNLGYSWKADLSLLFLFIISILYFCLTQLSLINWFDPKKFWATIISIFSVFLIDYIGHNDFTVILFYFTLVFPYSFSFFLKWNWKRPNFWVIFTILFIIIFFYLGIIGLNKAYGYEPLILNLHASNGKNVQLYGGNFSCYSNANTPKILANSNVNCSITPALKDLYNASLIVISHNGRPTTYDLSDMEFTAPENSYHIRFLANGLDERALNITLDSSWEYSFYTLEETKERRENLIKYFLALIAAILFSVPTMMYHFKELSKN